LHPCRALPSVAPERSPRNGVDPGRTSSQSRYHPSAPGPIDNGELQGALPPSPADRRAYDVRMRATIMTTLRASTIGTRPSSRAPSRDADRPPRKRPNAPPTKPAVPHKTPTANAASPKAAGASHDPGSTEANDAKMTVRPTKAHAISERRSEFCTNQRYTSPETPYVRSWWRWHFSIPCRPTAKAFRPHGFLGRYDRGSNPGAAMCG